MQNHASSDIGYVKLQANILVDGEKDNLEEGNDNELRWLGDLTEDSAKGDKYNRGGKVGQDEFGEGKMDLFPFTQKGIMEEAIHEDVPLNYNNREHEVVRDCRVGILLQEEHQHAEADEDHDMDFV